MITRLEGFQHISVVSFGSPGSLPGRWDKRSSWISGLTGREGGKFVQVYTAECRFKPGPERHHLRAGCP